MTSPKQGHLMILIIGPSGAGKGTLMHEITRHDPRIKFFITATTRAPREGEFDGVHYVFLTDEQFARRKAAGEFLETDDHYSHSYGTLKSIVDGHMAEGDDVISDINWRGVAQIQAKMPENVMKILILPPNMKELERRFEERAKTSKESAEKRAERLALIEDDLTHLNTPDYVFQNEDMAGSTKKDYDVIVINDTLQIAVEEILTAINKRRADFA